MQQHQLHISLSAILVVASRAARVISLWVDGLPADILGTVGHMDWAVLLTSLVALTRRVRANNDSGE